MGLGLVSAGFFFAGVLFAVAFLAGGCVRFTKVGPGGERMVRHHFAAEAAEVAAAMREQRARATSLEQPAPEAQPARASSAPPAASTPEDSGMPALAGAPTKVAVIPTQLDATAKGQVPSLFDDYLLAAVQNQTTGYEVIGQDDIAAILGFEQQKDLSSCNDASCIADIGGALGVDKIVVVKVARLAEDWVATGKIIDINRASVDNRISHIEEGDVKELIKAVPTIISQLFGTAAIAEGAPPRGPGAEPDKKTQRVASSEPEQGTAGEESASMMSGREGQKEPSDSGTQTAALTPTPETVETKVEEQEAGGIHLAIPIVVSAVGLSTVGGGIGVGVMANDAAAESKSSYDSTQADRKSVV